MMQELVAMRRLKSKCRGNHGNKLTLSHWTRSLWSRSARTSKKTFSTLPNLQLRHARPSSQYQYQTTMRITVAPQLRTPPKPWILADVERCWNQENPPTAAPSVVSASASRSVARSRSRSKERDVLMIWAHTEQELNAGEHLAHLAQVLIASLRNQTDRFLAGRMGDRDQTLNSIEPQQSPHDERSPGCLYKRRRNHSIWLRLQRHGLHGKTATQSTSFRPEQPPWRDRSSSKTTSSTAYSKCDTCSPTTTTDSELQPNKGE
jgi:hypothetical protein